MATNDLIDLSGELPAFAEVAAPIVSPAAAISTPKAEQPKPTDFNVVVSDETVSRYGDTVDLIKKLTDEGVEYKAQEAQSQLQYTKIQIASTQQLLGKLRRTLDKENKEYEKLADGKWYPGKILKGKAAHEEKTDAQEEVLNKAKTDVEQREALLAQLQHDANKLIRVIAEYDEKASRLRQAKQYEASVVQSVFGGDAGNEQENKLEAACAAAQQTMTNLNQYRAGYGRTQQLLKTALHNCKQAEQCLQQALRMARADVAQDFLSPAPMMNGPGGLVIDAQKRRYLEAGSQQLHAAAQMVIEAKQVMPSLPNVDLEKVNAIHKQPGLMMDMVFDNMITDMRSKRIIEQSLQDVMWLNREVANALNWVEQWLHGRINRDYAQAEAEYNRQRAELTDYRRACMMKMVAAAKSSSTVGQTVSQGQTCIKPPVDIL